MASICLSLNVLKNKNSSYWLSHITTALNGKLVQFVASILCHVRNIIKKYMGENVKNIYFSDKWK